MQRVGFWKAVAASLVFSFCLTACGGGGGDAPPPPPPTPLALSLSPTTATVTAVEGSEQWFSTTLTVDTQVVTGILYIGLVETGNATDDYVSVVANSNTTAVATFRTRPLLEVGTHTGRIDFYACRDAACADRYSPTPVSLNYTVTVQPVTLIATVTPSSITGTLEEGDSTEFTLNAQITVGSGGVDIGVGDSNGVFSTTPAISYTGANSYGVTLTLPSNIAPGTYTGSIYLYVCNSYPTVCDASSDVSLSPITVPYSITVTPMLRLDPVPTLTGLPEWGTYQGNAGHTGYVPVILDPARFAAQWFWNNPNASTTTLSPATTGSGKVVLVGSGYFSAAYLYALNESNGSLAWQHNFGSMPAVNHPAVADGRVFVASSGHGDTYMWSFDVADGTFRYSTPFYAQWEHYLAPVVKDGYVYTNGGYYGGMYRFKERTGQLTWFGELQQYDFWSPAVDDQYAYAYTGYEFAALDIQTGERAFTVSNPGFNWWGYTLNIAPVLPGDGSVVLVDGVFNFGYAHANNLIRYSIAGQNESWRVGGSFASDPVVANGTLYVINAATNALESRSLATGQLLWSWTPTISGETLNVKNIVLTDNLAFISTTSGTRAISLATRQSVWSNPAVGRLALSSNKKLYIVSDQRVDAINLD